jgi:multiple sugar transport system permease protein
MTVDGQVQQLPADRVTKGEGRGTLFYVGQAVIWALMIAVALYEILPIMWMFSTSLRLPGESFELPPSFFPTSWNWENYINVLTSEQIDYPLFFFNSIKLALSVTLGQIVTCSMAAFAFSRLRFKGRDVFFFLFLASMMVPGQVTVIPVFILIRQLGLIDSHWAIILPGLTSAFGVFLLRQHFMSLPSELMDAAKIDGASFYRIYWGIMLPLVGPGLAALGIFTFLAQWNNFFGPLLFLRSWQKLTLPIALVTLQGYMGSGSRAEVLASIMLSILPVLIVFLFAQRYVLQGIALTGMKG